MFLNQYVGKQLQDIAEDVRCGSLQGICIFQLDNEKDTTGKCVAEDFDIRRILKDNPELKTKTIKLINNFYGECVFRVL